ncbi:MAG TPA: flagellar type III secretion system pore protein FliP [Treponemataceae bacterium]|nr:flagellar type III secretion system pore protein FliP [Treponemataceae bacterium]
MVLFFSISSISAQSTVPPNAATGTTEFSSNVNRVDIPLLDLSVRQPETNQEVAFSIQVLLLLTILTLAPSILILCTTFLRFSIVLDFIKRALSLQQVPPTAVLNGIALFMTLFIMWPTFNSIYTNAYKPLSDGTIGLEEAMNQTESPMRLFMYSQMSEQTDYVKLFMSISDLPKPQTLADVPTYVLIPSYILHELTVAFKIGVLLYIPFIVIDMVVASILMSMGMIMLPPVQISMPFKLMLFVLIDGWGLLTQQLFASIVR